MVDYLKDCPQLYGQSFNISDNHILILQVVYINTRLEKCIVIIYNNRSDFMSLKKRFTPQMATLMLICICMVIGFVRDGVLRISASNDGRQIIIIDAGHGGFDGGAVAVDGTVEKDINLNIALRLGEMLKFEGYNVVMTRTEDTGTEDNSDDKIAVRKKSDLDNRLALMKTYDDAIFVSIHLNKFTSSSARGAQVFYTPNFDEARLLGESIQSSLINLMQPENERVAKQGTSSTYIIKKATVPTVIVECGFLSNSSELKLLKDNDYQSQIAFAISAGIKEYFSERK